MLLRTDGRRAILHKVGRYDAASSMSFGLQPHGTPPTRRRSLGREETTSLRERVVPFDAEDDGDDIEERRLGDATRRSGDLSIINKAGAGLYENGRRVGAEASRNMFGVCIYIWG
jgi:hypothetical protein